jgi:predicted small lipoprotein YifL
MIRRFLALALLSIFVTACGVKTDLLMPNGKKTPQGQKDPSHPVHTLGR